MSDSLYIYCKKLLEFILKSGTHLRTKSFVNGSHTKCVYVCMGSRTCAAHLQTVCILFTINQNLWVFAQTQEELCALRWQIFSCSSTAHLLPVSLIFFLTWTVQCLLSACKNYHSLCVHLGLWKIDFQCAWCKPYANHTMQSRHASVR